MKCSSCGFENPDNISYCIDCGSKLFYNHVTNTSNIKTKKIGISILLSILFPGFSYFYLKQWYRGALFILVYQLIFFNVPFLGGWYVLIYSFKTNLMIYLLLIGYLLLYLVQIYDVIKLTKLINQGVIKL